MKNILFLLSAVVLPLFSAEYFLSPGQKALPLLKKLRPGDVLTVRKGLHPPVGEIIRIKGAPGKPIVIRGEDPDLSLFSPWNTGKKLQWSKTPGKKYLWETPLAREAAGVCDPEAGEVFICAPSVETMDFFRNTFFYDKKNKKLYVHTPDGGTSFCYLQNVCVSGETQEQGLAVALCLAEQVLGDKGAFRVHGGGFAGTVQAFVPVDMAEEFRTVMNAAFGRNACSVLHIRPVGAARIC